MLALLPLILPLFLLPFTVQAGTFGGQVVNLDTKSFKNAMATEHASMVVFYAPWCGHCKNLAPKYEAAASSLSPLIPFYAVDCDAAPNKPLCAEHQIKGFPTIKAFPRASKGAAKDYQGERESAPLVEYAKNLVPDRVRKLRVDSGTSVEPVIQKFLEEKTSLPHALLIHPSAPSIPFLWKVLAHRLSNKMHLGYVRDSSSHSVLASLGIYDAADTTRDTTRAVVWEAGADRAKLVEYDGTMKFNALLEWLQAQLDSSPPPSSPSEKAQKQKPVKAESSDDAAMKKAKIQAKLEEEERRDKARREKLLEKALRQEKAEDHVEGDSGATKVDEAADAVPAEAVEQVVESVEEVEAADPAVPEAPGESVTGAGVDEPENTGIAHEEL